jgi:4-hydroxy-2-oxoheptanedioate aldolase
MVNIKSIPLGIFQNFPSPMVSRYLVQVGFEWIILDMQHGCLTYETLYECIHVIRAAGAQPFVRVSVGNPGEIQKALDLGAAGVVVPMTNCLQEAQAAAAAAKFPPLGERSIGGDFRYQFGRQYPSTANHDTKLFVQMEHIRSAEAIDEIMAVDGVDGCFIGPTDLALSLGLGHEDFEANPQHVGAIRRTLEACLRAQKIAAINAYSIADARERIDAGFQWITMRSDMDLFMDAGKSLVSKLKDVRAGVAAAS